jgi:hypothetical protein
MDALKRSITNRIKQEIEAEDFATVLGKPS